MKKIILATASAAMLLGSIPSAVAEVFPATVAFRKAATGPGYVLIINTTVKQDLPAMLTVTSGALGSVNRRTVNLTWRHPTQLGYLEGVTVYPGDHIELANNYYDTLTVDLPR
ncbi:MAG: hypothetical protein JZU58_24600 [Curvibacter lanceolatus]|uniref:hypothetical protein n=1 Tax=Curvibacter lanceolatus TaxID=86182 RepID=UPI0023532A80|nr:hypothetical protein [Curvibacter lanceolatus]MBV5295529.1 hypothetical protein [Curvibacter lanceolatus]